MHPYEDMGPEAFWKTAVAETGPFGLSDLWTPKFPIKPRHKIVTAGSCFAQHFGRALQERGYKFLDCEPPPPFLDGPTGRDFGYGLFSTRTGNIYTPSMLLQWLRLAFGEAPAPDEIWEQGGKVFDPLRPTIEPGGFASDDELLAAREVTLKALRDAVTTADIFVFTLGLTERWLNDKTGLEYAICPGTVAGRFDPKRNVFDNTNTRTTQNALHQVLRFLRSKNTKLNVLLTVSPVPLTATASGKHVLVATQYSKSVLRGAAGIAAERFGFVDYFPSYEIITHPIFRGMFFAPNMRSVVAEGVETVMKHFFSDQARVFGAKDAAQRRHAPVRREKTAEDVRCDEEMLNAFAKRPA